MPKNIKWEAFTGNESTTRVNFKQFEVPRSFNHYRVVCIQCSGTLRSHYTIRFLLPQNRMLVFNEYKAEHI